MLKRSLACALISRAALGKTNLVGKQVSVKGIWDQYYETIFGIISSFKITAIF